LSICIGVSEVVFKHSVIKHSIEQDPDALWEMLTTGKESNSGVKAKGF